MTWAANQPSPPPYLSSSSSSSSISSSGSPRRALSKSPSSGATADTENVANDLLEPPAKASGNDDEAPPPPPPPKSKTPGKSHSRRGHFKSRLGCFNCKRRRVKCNEARPSCAPCTRLGLSCAYPDPKTPAAAALTTLQINPSGLAMEDLRFFHRFMTKAFPTLPFRGDSVWLDASAMSHEYQMLAHSVLGLGASHISLHGNVDYTEQALSHRVTAIRMVNERLSSPSQSPADADAVFGAVLCLIAQTGLLADGMCEYHVMTRGCMLLMQAVVKNEDKSIFNMFTTEEHMNRIRLIISDEHGDFTNLHNFHRSLLKMKHLLVAPSQMAYFDGMLLCVSGMHESPEAAWSAFVALYHVYADWSSDVFNDFIDINNFPSQLLIIHGFLLDYVLGPLCLPVTLPNNSPGRKGVVIGWARDVLARLPPDLKEYGAWVKEYSDALEHGDWRYLLSP